MSADWSNGFDFGKSGKAPNQIPSADWWDGYVTGVWYRRKYSDNV